MSAQPVVGTQFHPKFAPLFEDKWRFIILRGGRASMKSWAAAQHLLIRGARRKMRFLCCRELMNSIAESTKKLLEDQVEALGLAQFYHAQRDGIDGANGTEVFFMGLRNDPQKVKSTEGVDIAVVEEAQSISQESLDTLIPTIRKDGSQIWFIYNQRFDTDPIHKMAENPPPDTCVIDVNYRDAMDMGYFPQVLVSQMEHMRMTNPLMYEHVWEGKIVPNLSAALWTLDDINNARVSPGSQPEFGRLVIAVDPAVTANKHSDETGIVAVGCTKGTPRHYYLLMDGSGRYSPEGWARKVMDMYESLGASSVVCERNQGGDMVLETLRNYCRGQGLAIPKLNDVWASKGKAVRAEPVAALYTQGLVHHVGAFPVLERELLQFDPLKTDQPSPNRLDAACWAIHELSAGRAPMRIANGALEALSYLRHK